MQWLSPTWLFGLLALAVPVALHLLSRGRGRRVPLASLRLLSAEISLRGRRLQPSDLPQLLLRAGLLAAIVLALAEPVLDLAAAPTPDGAWLLISPGLDPSRAAGALRHLRAGASEVRYLAPGLPADDPAGARGQLAEPASEQASERSEQPSAISPPAPDVWSLLAEADRLAPDGVELRVLGEGRLAELRGERPVLAHAVVWEEIPPPPAPRRALVGAGPWAEGAVRVRVATSDARAFAVSSASVPVPGGASAGASSAGARAPSSARPGARPGASGSTGESLRAIVGDGTVAVALDGGADLRVRPLDPPHVALHASAEHGPSAAVLRDACTDAAAALGVPLRFDEDPNGAALRAWLDDAPAPDAWTTGTAPSLSEATAPGTPCDAAASGEDRVEVVRCAVTGPPAPASTRILWRSDTGMALLTAAPETPGRLRLATRFDPEWSGLGDSELPARWCAGWITAALASAGQWSGPSVPPWLAPGEAPAESRQAAGADPGSRAASGARATLASRDSPAAPDSIDARRAAAGQRLPALKVVHGTLPRTAALAPWLWLLAAVLAMLERRRARRGA